MLGGINESEGVYDITRIPKTGDSAMFRRDQQPGSRVPKLGEEGACLVGFS
jgi:hypothetical protein